MKKATLLSIVTASALFAGSINIQSGWNLVGAVEDINPSTINCAKTVWTWDNGTWSLYQNMGVSDNFNYPYLTNLSKGKGFWINSDCDTAINFDDNSTYVDDNNTYYDGNNTYVDDNMSYGPDMNTTPVTTIAWGSFTDAVGMEEDGHGDYSVWNIALGNPITATIVNKMYDNSSMWVTDEQHDINVTVNNEQNISVAGSDGFGADIIITKTEQVFSIDDMNFTDLYVSDIEFHVTAVGDGWTDVWDWAPEACDENGCTAITNITDFTNNALEYNNWFGDKDYAMLDGNVSDTTGNIVRGEVTGTYSCDNDDDGVQDDTCYTVGRTTDVIGSWMLDGSGLHMDMPYELQTLNIVSDANSQTGYFVESQGQDKVGSVWNEKIFTGTDATESLAQQVISGTVNK